MGKRSGKWHLMQYLATDCARAWGKVTDGVMAQPDAVNCQNISRYVADVKTGTFVTQSLQR